MGSDGKRATAVRIRFVFFVFVRETCSRLEEKGRILKCAIGKTPLANAGTKIEEFGPETNSLRKGKYICQI